VVPVALGPLPGEADVAAYHLLPDGDHLLVFEATVTLRRVVEAGAHAVLVGEGLVRATDVAAKLRELKLA